VKASINDAGILNGISPMDLTAYLRGRGWVLEVHRDVYSLWSKSEPGRGEFEVLVPSSDRLRDYGLRISAALSVLESAEDRSQLSIARDLGETASDVVRFRLSADDAASGEVPIDYGLKLLQAARDSMLAAASAAVEPRPVFHTRKPAAAATYLSRLQLGQTEVGSYVVALLSRVPPALTAHDTGQLFEPPDEPFNRQVTLGLMRSLRAAKTAAASVQVSGELDAMHGAVEAGVSANLCTALASVGSDIELDGLDISVSWARSRPVPTGPDPIVRFSPDDLTILDEAARWLKDLGNVEDYTLYGSVVALESEDAEEGKVVVAGLVDGKPRRVHLELGKPWYAHAIKAHAEHCLIRAVGDIAKHGRTWSMLSPQSFSVPDLGQD
jgi:hypothetical protein